jgi:glutamine amidotransferase-like uncharacterized protein
VTTNDQKSNKNAELLGDRDLAAWVGSGSGGIYAFATYTYNNMFGAGNANAYQNIPYRNQAAQWHFVYFGYSRVKR